MQKTSVMELLKQVYPEYNWLPWRFSSFSSSSLVTNHSKRRYYVEWMAKQLSIKETKDWYTINAEVIDLIFSIY